MFNIKSLTQERRGGETLKVHMDDNPGTHQLSAALADYIVGAGSKRPVVVLCIGTDRSTGDCLGPLVGTQLQAYSGVDFNVLGTLEKPVHANNLNDIMEQINSECPNSFVIAVDACLGHLDSVGYLSLAKGSLKPGAGVHKNLPLVGEAHLTGIVNVGGFMEYMVLQNTRLSLVMRMANQISNIIFKASSILQASSR